MRSFFSARRKPPLLSPPIQRYVTFGIALLCFALIGGCGGGGHSSSGSSSTATVGVAISPVTSTLVLGGSETFTASVTNASNRAVTWSVAEGSAGGTITTAGVYTAPANSGTFHVLATSIADTGKTAIATVTVQATSVANTVTVNPLASTLAAGGTEVFTASVTGLSSQSVTWTATGGTITSAGVYTAPVTPGSYTITATSTVDTSKTVSVTVIVTATNPIVVSVSPNSSIIAIGGTQIFTATVSGTSNRGVTWSATGGTITSTGVYTAPSTAGTYTITVTSTADTTQSATALVTAQPGSTAN